MTIRFKDFVPEDITSGFAITRKYETAEDVVTRANAWVSQSGVSIMNVETVVMPKVLLSSGTSGTSVAIDVGSAIMSQWVQVVRVWYSAVP